MSLKKSTGLTGLPVCKNPAHILSILYGKILRALNKFPSDSAYRTYTEEIVARRAAIVSCCCPNEIEEKIKCGQVEELIIQAENELRLIRNLAIFKPWEPLIRKPESDQWVWPPAK